jgi:predicted XRE-type DNA-binding protein
MTYKYQYNGIAEKSLAFVGSSREDLRSFPADARRRAGFELDQVQRGLMPTDWRPVTSIGPGVEEGAEDVQARPGARTSTALRASYPAPQRTEVSAGAHMARKITHSTGNVFEDLGFPREEAENLKVRSALMALIRVIIVEKGLTQARAAKLFGVTQPRISDLVRGKIELFSIDALVNMVAASGRHVAVSIETQEKEVA